jgi:hemerythrin superfamily protein
VEGIWFKPLISNEESELGFQIQVNLVNNLENTHRLVNYLEVHRKFPRTSKIMKLIPKFIVFLLDHGK